MDFLKQLGSVDAKALGELDSLWKQLDNLAENDPKAYDKFMKDTRDQFMKDEGFQPTPCYSIEMPLHDQHMFSSNPVPGDWFVDIAINFMCHERIMKSTWPLAEAPPHFSLNSRHERVIKGKRKVYYDAVFHPEDLPHKPVDGASAARDDSIAGVLTEVMMTESNSTGKIKIPGGLPSVNSAKYLGNSTVKTHITKMCREHKPTKEFSKNEEIKKSVEQIKISTKPIEEEEDISIVVNKPVSVSKSGFLIEEIDPSSRKKIESKPLVEEIKKVEVTSKKPVKSFGMTIIEEDCDESEIVNRTGSPPKIVQNIFNIENKSSSQKNENISEKQSSKAENHDDNDDRVLKNGIRIPGPRLVHETEHGEWMMDADKEVERLRKEKLYKETDESNVNLFAATKTKLPTRSKALPGGLLIQEL